MVKSGSLSCAVCASDVVSVGNGFACPKCDGGGEQTWLFDLYELWDGDFLDLGCESCAVAFAEERKLEWRGGTSMDSYTEDSEERGMGASCTPNWAMGESDYPHSCACGVYLKTGFTAEGVAHLKDFPKWVQDLYGM